VSKVISSGIGRFAFGGTRSATFLAVSIRL
jgi:hypothetical protein